MAPMTLMTTGFALSAPLVLSIAMIWLAHIGFDRAPRLRPEILCRFRLHPSSDESAKPGFDSFAGCL